MSIWAYRASSRGADRTTTEAILREHGFLWRPLYKQTEQRTADGFPPMHTFVGRVEPGDRIFFFFTHYGRYELIGGFEVLRPTQPADPRGRAPAVRVVRDDSPLAGALARAGYLQDVFLERFTGFDVTPKDDAPPGRPHFAGRNSLGGFPNSSEG